MAYGPAGRPSRGHKEHDTESRRHDNCQESPAGDPHQVHIWARGAVCGEACSSGARRDRAAQDLSAL